MEATQTRIEPRRASGHYDYVVVGTGPGGATVARELARGGHSVLILERGHAAPVDGSARQTVRELLRPRSSLHMAGNVTLLRGNTVGGSSIFFFGSAWEPPLDLLAEHGLDLRAEVELVKEDLRPAVLPRDLMGPRARRIADSALELGYEWRSIPKFLDPDELGDPPMGAYAAPSYEAKWNARKFVDQAVDAGATLLTGARVERVLVEGGTARGVEFVHERRSRRASAGRVVLAAGGFGSPRILRASGIERAGREWFYDPLISVVGSVAGLDADPELPMVAGAEIADEGYMLTDITVPPWWFGMDAALAGRPDRLFSHRRSLSIMVKIRDELSGEITRRGGVGKRLTDGDREKLSAGYQRARRILEHAGARRIWRTGYAAVHPGATAKVGDIVDGDLETEVDGLYVCDASVIPVAWGLPPSMTVLAIARKLARHLIEERAPAAPAPSPASG